jgi:hypothetical protein
MGVFHDGPVTGNGPIPFSGNLGPLHLPSTEEHDLTLGFYLDSLGDAIRLDNSVELHSIPEPTTGAAFALAMLTLLHRPRTVD